jgi:3-deoxy-D-manno-octulosonate 8-phosphate phosphatase (KDO 8-P phosphatase)
MIHYGVMTDNKALINQEGIESVMVNRSDGLAISMFKDKNLKQVIISTEINTVVQKRAEKLGVECISGVKNKLEILINYAFENNVNLQKVIYVGNDVNDLEAMEHCGLPIAPSDAHHKIKSISKLSTKAQGGNGVIRELYDMLNY